MVLTAWYLCIKVNLTKSSALKKDNPLVIGLGDGENFIASDIPAIINHTRRTFIMSDGEIATVTADGVWVQDLEGTPISKKVFEVNWNAEAAEKAVLNISCSKKFMNNRKLCAIP